MILLKEKEFKMMCVETVLRGVFFKKKSGKREGKHETFDSHFDGQKREGPLKNAA